MANSANIIKIKRSSTANKPSTLYSGELAYSYGTTPGTNPERLFFGSGDDGNGNATRIDNIGGLYYTRLIDASAAGTLTTNASSIPILSATGTINDWRVGNLELTGNTLSTTNNNLNVILSANGTGLVQINTSSNSFTLPSTRTSTSGYVLTANTDGTTSWAASASALTLKADTLPGSDTSETINLLTDTLNIAGDSAAISTTVTITGTTNKTYKTAISARLATTSLTGVAKFDSSTFSVDGYGNVTVKSAGISNTQLANSSLYIGTTLVTLGDASGTTTSLAVDISGKATTAGNADTVTNGVYTTDTGTVTNTMLQYSTISGVALGGTLAALSNGNNIQSFTYDGSSTQSITLATDLTDVNSVSSSSGTGPVTLNASGGHSYTFNTDGTVTFNSAYTFPSTVAGGTGYVLTDAAGNGTLSWAQPASSLSIPSSGATGDTQSAVTLNLLTDQLSFAGDGTININESNSVSGSGNIYTYTATIADGAIGNGKLANSSITVNGTSFALGDNHTITANTTNALTFATTGGASPSTTFDGSSAVTIDYSTVGAAPSAGSSDIVTVGTITSGVWHGSTIDNSYLTNSSITVGSTSISLGGTATTITGLTEVDVGNLKIATNDISAKTGSGAQNVVINSTGSDGSTTHGWTFGSDGSLEVAGKITNVTDPTNPQDAATKAYVDATASGLKIHDPVTVATTAALSTIGGTVAYVDGPGTNGDPLSIGATLTFTTPITVLDGYSFTGSGTERILVKDQVSKKQNGVYVYTSSTTWTRATDFDIAANITGADFMFVEDGLVNGSTGWVQTDQSITSIGASGSDITFVQFSAANSYLAGDGINITGNSIAVKLGTYSGLSTSSGSLVISGIAGTAATTGLTFTNGVLQIGTDGSSIDINSSGNLEIKSTWAGQTAITTVGTITTGTWHGDTITYAYGGTGQTSYAKGDIIYASATNTLSKLTAGTDGMVLQQQGGVPTWGYMDGGTY